LYSSNEAEERLAGNAGESSDGRADADEDNRERGGCLTEVGLRLRASVHAGGRVRSVDSIRFDSIRASGGRCRRRMTREG